MEGIDGCYPHDALAVAAALAPDGLFALETGGYSLGAEGGFQGLLRPNPAGHQVRVARDADPRQALDWIETCLARAAELTPLATAPYTGRQKDQTHAS